MKPSYAMTLSSEGIGLLHRTGGGWQAVGQVSLDNPDLGQELDVLRRTAAGLEPGGITTKLVIPNDQILYRTIEVSGIDESGQSDAVRAAMEGATPYALDQLAIDWRPAGPGRVAIAACARQTLREAESFAEDNRFNPVSLVARPDSAADFPGEPFFGETRAAASLLDPGTRVEPDSDPVPSDAFATAAPEPPAPDTGPAKTVAAEPASTAEAAAQPEPKPEPEAEPEPAPDASFSDAEPEAPSEAPAAKAPPRPRRRLLSVREQAEAMPARAQVIVGLILIVMALLLWASVVMRETVTSWLFPGEPGLGQSERILAQPADPVSPRRAARPGTWSPLAALESPADTAPTVADASGTAPAVAPGRAFPGGTEPAASAPRPDLAALRPQGAPAQILPGRPGETEPLAGRPGMPMRPEAVPPALLTGNDLSATRAERSRAAAALGPAEARTPALAAPGPDTLPPAAAEPGLIAAVSTTRVIGTEVLPDPEEPADMTARADPPGVVIRRGSETATEGGARRLTALPPRHDLPRRPTPPTVATELAALAAPDSTWPAPAAAGVTMPTDEPLAALPALPADPTRDALPGQAPAASPVVEVAAIRPPLVEGRVDLLDADPEALIAEIRPPLRPVPQVEPESVEVALAEALEAVEDGDTISALRPRKRPPAPPRPAATAAAPRIPSNADVARQATQENALRVHRVTLLGTVGTSSQKSALVKVANRVVKVKVGDRLDGGKVTQITATMLIYVKNGREHKLELPRG